MKIASLQYSYEILPDFEAYAKKVTNILENLKKKGVELVVFPEYAGFEMISFASLDQMQEYLPFYLKLFQDLSSSLKMYICSGSLMVKTPDGIFNRSYFFSSSGKSGFQDKCNLTAYEKNEGLLKKGNSFTIFETDFGKIGICICYDVEFPTLVYKWIVEGVNVLLIPAYTSSVHGYNRVSLCARARAIENQCYVVHSSMVGLTDTDMTYGAAGIYTPADNGFPEDGILAVGIRDEVGEVIVELDFVKLEAVRKRGDTHNYADSLEMKQREFKKNLVDLR